MRARRSPLAAVLVVALAIAAMAPAAAWSQAFYKWTDRDGKVQYGDKPPTGFAGPVTRIEVDAKANTRPAFVPPRAPEAQAEEGVPPPPVDIAKKRRDLRTKLRAQIDDAQAKLAAAKAALAAAGDPRDSETQVVQRAATAGAMPRSNCRVVKGADGKPATICPVLVPSSAYYERVRSLEDEVKKAEEDLAAAEEAYRRGVD